MKTMLPLAIAAALVCSGCPEETTSSLKNLAMDRPLDGGGNVVASPNAVQGGNVVVVHPSATPAPVPAPSGSPVH